LNACLPIVQAAGFKVQQAWEKSALPKRTVLRTEPAGGITAPQASIVTIHVSLGRILFAEGAGNCASSCTSQIWVMDADGANRQMLTDGTAGYDTSPVWSPDGTKIAFNSNRVTGHPDIWIMDSHGTGIVQLTKGPNDSSPAWSPDGTKIAFQRRFSYTNFEIVVITADAITEKQLTHNGVASSDPAWSPDGNKIAFSNNKDGAPNIYVMDSATGTGQMALTTGPAKDPQGGSFGAPAGTPEAPRWSPDGTEIAFTTSRDGPRHIYLMNVADKDPRRLTNGPGDDYIGAWAPDGTAIVFFSTRTGPEGIYRVGLDDVTSTLTNNPPHGDGWPDW